MIKLSSKLQEFKNKRKWNIQQLFCATNFESLMYPCFTLGRILGIFPYKINASTIKTCKPCYILSCIIFCVFCVCQLINFHDVNVSKDIIPISRKLQANSFLIFNSIITVFALILNKSRMRLIQTILELSFRLPSESYQNLSRLIHTKDIFGFLFLIVQASIYLNVKGKIMFKIITLYIIQVAHQMDMLYMNCVCVLKACFKQINDNLTNLRELVVNDEPYILMRIHKQRNLFLLMELKALQKQHLAIIETVHMLNMIFSLHLLLTTVITFLQVTFMLYFYLMNQEINMLASKLSKQTYEIFLIMIIIYYPVKMILIIWACETGMNQAKEINTTVHSVLNNTNDEQLKYELQLFSLQLMYRENMFSAKVFNMDATLLTMMMGCITTYFLILIQFLFISHSCDA